VVYFFLENPTFVLKTDLDFGSKILWGRTVRGVGIAQVFLLLFLLLYLVQIENDKKRNFHKKSCFVKILLKKTMSPSILLRSFTLSSFFLNELTV